jgi:uroporphyrinogen decarboxylase
MKLHNDRFLRACRREPTDCTPVWLMRQAGRYMPEYRAVRERHGFLEMVKTPELAAEVTLQPVRAFPVDAAIIFADILPPIEGMGIQLTFEKGEGPVIHNPVRSAADVAALRQPDPRETVAFTLAAIRLVKQELAGRLPLIGFSGAPFTLASYLIEGGGSREYRRTKQLMYREPETWHALMRKLAALVGDYLVAQIEAGADAVQIFDSWVGALAPDDFAEFVLPYIRQVVQTVRGHSAPAGPGHGQTGSGPPAPLIYFGTDTGGLLPLLRQTEADVLGVDWRIGLDDAWAQIGPGFAIQGNLDPMALFAPWPALKRRADEVLRRAAGRPGHIFNLGHGILTETPVEQVAQLIAYVHEESKK